MKIPIPLALIFVVASCASAPPPPSGTAPAGVSVPAAALPGELSMAPERPRPGQRVVVTYTPRNRADLGPRLTLRARLRTPEGMEDNDGMGSRSVAVLQRGRNGGYSGSFALPERVVYAALAIEDPNASWSDTRAGHFWDVLAHEVDGRPAFAALEQRFNDYMPRDQREALRSARDMVAAYPDRIQGWSTLAQAERWVLSEDSVAARVALHRDRVRAFDRALAGAARVPADEAGHLFVYATNVGEGEVAGRWRTRILAEHPNHFFAVQERALDVFREQRENPVELLSRLEALWPGAQGVRSRIVLFMLAGGAAASAGDSAAVLRWADRQAAENSFTRSAAASMLAEIPPVRQEGIRRLRAEIAHLEAAPDEERPLGSTRAEYRAASTRSAAALRASLGTALVAAGSAAEGAGALEQAVGTVWNVDWFRTLGKAKQETTDRAGAIRAFAAVAADPGTPAAMGDSLRRVLGVDSATWRVRIDSTRAEMIRRTLAAARSGPVVDARAANRDGTPLQLGSLRGGAPTVVAVWSPFCPPAKAAMPRIAALAATLQREGVPLLAVTDISRDNGERYLSQSRLALPIVYDHNGEVAAALGSWGTPQLFVLDAEGRLRFAFSSMDDVRRQVAALQTERRQAP